MYTCIWTLIKPLFLRDDAPLILHVRTKRGFSQDITSDVDTCTDIMVLAGEVVNMAPRELSGHEGLTLI